MKQVRETSSRTTGSRSYHDWFYHFCDWWDDWIQYVSKPKKPWLCNKYVKSSTFDPFWSGATILIPFLDRQKPKLGTLENTVWIWLLQNWPLTSSVLDYGSFQVTFVKNKILCSFYFNSIRLHIFKISISSKSSLHNSFQFGKFFITVSSAFCRLNKIWSR